MTLHIYESPDHQLVFGVLENGDRLLESIRELARQADIHTGILLTGIGSLQKGRIHTVASNHLPPEELFFDLPGPLEVTNFNGIIANYQPHIHISMMDPQGRYYGGHLEEGCEVLTLSEFSILRSPGTYLARQASPGGLFAMLSPQNK